MNGILIDLKLLNNFIKYIIFLILFLALTLNTRANIDSLNLALKNTNHDTTRIIILSELSNICEVKDILKYAIPCKNLCKKAMVLKIPPQDFYLTHLSSALNNIGFSVKEAENNQKALFYYEQALKIDKILKNKDGIATSYNNIGLVYDNLGDISLALEYYHKSLKIREEINDKQGIAISLNNIGAVYKDQGDLSKGLEFFLRSMRIYEEIEDKEGFANSLNNIGTLYSLKNDYNKSMEYYKKSLLIFEELKYKSGISLALGNIGANYKDLGDLTSALNILFKSLKIQEEIKDKIGITFSLNNIASVLLIKGETNQAFFYAIQCMNVAKETGYPFAIKDAAELLSQVYEKQNKGLEALEMYKLFVQMKDSTNNEETKKATAQQQAKYEYEKQKVIDVAEHEKQLAIEQEAQVKQKIITYATGGGLGLVVIFLIFVFNRLQVTRKQKSIIETQKLEVEQQKEVVEKAHLLLEEKNNEILASIRYAKRIQDALMTSQKYIERNMNRLKSLK